MRKSVALLVTGFALVWAVPAGAQGGHTSCKGFGQEVSVLGQSGVLGGIASGIGTSGPGAAAEQIGVEQAAFCSP
jgi:hypothetical protein